MEGVGGGGWEGSYLRNVNFKTRNNQGLYHKDWEKQIGQEGV